MWEFYRLSGKTGNRPQNLFGIFIGILLFLCNFLYVTNRVDQKFFLLFIPLALSIFIIEIYRKNKSPVSNIAYTFLGLIYIALPFSLFNYFVFSFANTVKYNPNILLGFFFLLWANDTGAYLIGMPLGKHKLFKEISPKKSWEGFIGGVIITMIIAYINSIFFKELRTFDWFVTALIVVIMGTFGDLVESLFKRSVGVKDSGTILPGHGGILDRFDSVLLSSPVVFLYLQIIS